MRIDPDWHRNIPLPESEEEQRERSDSEVFHDIIAGVIILICTMLIVAPLLVASWYY